MPEYHWLPLLRLMPLWIPLLRAILRRTGRRHNNGDHDGPPAHLQALLRQMRPGLRKELFAQLVGFQRMAKLANRSLIGYGSRPRSIPTNCRRARVTNGQ